MEDLYSNVFQALPGLVCLLKTDLTIINANPSLVETLGKFCIGLKFDTLLPKLTDRSYLLDSVKFFKSRYAFDDMEFLTSAGTIIYIVMLCCKDSFLGVIVVKWTISRVCGSEHLLMTGTSVGPAVPVSAPHQDSLDAVDAHACPIPYSKQELIYWFNRIPIGMHSVAGDGTILWANSTLLTLLGYEADEYIGRSLLKVRSSLHCPSKYFIGVLLVH